MKVLQIHDKDQALVVAGTAEGIEGLCKNRGGGLNVYLAHLVRRLRETGSEVAVIGMSGDLGEDAVGDSGSYRVRAFRYRFRSSVVSALVGIIEREDPDVIHLHSMPTLHPRLVRRLAEMRPVLWMFHDVTPVCFRRNKLRRDGEVCTHPAGLGCVARSCHLPGRVDGLLQDMVRLFAQPIHLRSYRDAAMIAVPSGYLREVLIQNGVDAHRIRVLPLFSRFSDDGEPAPESASPPGILYVGRLDPEKGILEFIDALGRLEEQRWQARVVGVGPMLNLARRRVDDLGLGSRVSFHGEADAGTLEAHYRWCSMVVMPSLVPEAFGIVGVEAMSVGRPIVAFESGGVTEWLDDGVNGILVRHGDVAALSRSIDLLIADPDLRQRYGTAGRAMQRDEFTLDRHLERLMPLYERLVEQRTVTSR